MFDLSDRKAVAAARERIASQLKRLDGNLRNRLLAVISQRADPLVPLDPQGYFQSLSWETVAELSDTDLIDFGAHSVNHEILTSVPRGTCVYEIKESQSIIQARTGKPVRYFAYPNGTRLDYDPDIQAIAADHFDAVLTTIPGLTDVGEDPRELKRLPVGNDATLLDFKLGLSGTLEYLDNIVAKCQSRAHSAGLYS
jgi:peptidoglycan/xylan/chitin deacetylase (PgdA/CDA1 family)